MKRRCYIKVTEVSIRHKMLDKGQRGFTIIEVVVVVGIMGLLVGLGLWSLLPLRGRSDVKTTTSQVIVVMQLARNRAISSLDDQSYGVHFESDRFVLFTGTTYDSGAGSNEVHLMAGDLEIYDISVGGGNDVVFDLLAGTTSMAGSIGVRNINDPTNSLTVSVLASGSTGLAGTVSPTDTRITDTRHLHFDLGWSIIQGATTLTLFFNDSPTVQEDVTMADYFDAGQDEFDWEDTIDVNGQNQTMRVHTHSLNATDTMLSIHRDRRYNDQAVDLSVDGIPIVSYTLDGTATVGAGGGTMTEQ